jgi:transposase
MISQRELAPGCYRSNEERILMSIAWSGTVREHASCNLGPLAVVAPLLEEMDVAGIIDRHLPPDPQLEYSHGRVLRLLLAARLCQPLALVNVATWAEESGAEFLWDIPADKLNDDRLGRALDALFSQRHSILASVAAHVISTYRLPMSRLHYDTTHLLLCGAYEATQPRAGELPLPPTTPSAFFPPAHITYGYAAPATKMIHAGVCAVVDDLGAVPIYGHTIAGNHNGRTAIAEQFQLLQDYLEPEPLLMISDRGTYSAAHVARLERAGHHVLCSVPWAEFQPLFAKHRDRLFWNRASFLSIEQRRRRDTDSALPREHYELAVLRHALTDPERGEIVPCRVIFVFSSADQKVCQKERARTTAAIRKGLERIAQNVARGYTAYCDTARIERSVLRVLGKRRAARYFHWHVEPLTPAEQAALPPPRRGCRRASCRLVYHYDAALAQEDAAADGYSALVTTAPLERSADSLFTDFKQQNYLEQAHHQWKTPLAVRPLFLKSPERVEALVYLLKIALTAYHLIQRRYRQAVPADAPVQERRLTTESILRAFRVCPLLKETTALGCVIHPVALTRRQREILGRLHFLTPAQTLRQRLPHYPRE